MPSHHVDDVSNDTVVRQRSQRSVHPPKKYIPEEGKMVMSFLLLCFQTGGGCRTFAI